MTQQRARAGDTLLGMARVRAEERGGPSGYADRQEAAVRAPVEAPVRAVGGELVPAEDFATKTLPAILDTLVNPDAVAADASRDRLDLAKNAGSLELALDTADTIQAGDALERMLAHQLATSAGRRVVIPGSANLEQVQMAGSAGSVPRPRRRTRILWRRRTCARASSLEACVSRAISRYPITTFCFRRAVKDQQLGLRRDQPRRSQRRRNRRSR
ncbi:hypothetical protein ACU4GR_13430 [Methylobacterium oryzae CBMB20]